MTIDKPRLGVFKFSSCDGCQLSILDCEEELLDLADRMNIVFFHEAQTTFEPGPYDVALVEGSVSTEAEIERTKAIRAQTLFFVPFGVCATHGGIQAQKNYADVEEYKRVVYARPDLVASLPTSKPHHDYVKVDFELQGCPPNRFQLMAVISQLLLGRTPSVSTNSVCVECKRRGNVCVLVARNLPCMGPVTHDGCGALCPSLDRDCYACFGPMDDPKSARFAEELRMREFSPLDIVHRFRKITPNPDVFNKGAELYEREADQS
ncbi:MAG: oxidoreductase [Chloroflexota bacterium]|nr:MAG: oxidoreductase [Chloroflexota bacterium]